MNWVDIAILVIVLVNVIKGAISGFVRQVFSLLGIVLGIVIASRSYAKVGEIFGKVIPNPSINNILAFVLIFIAVAVVLIVIGRILEKVIKLLMLGWVNRAGGMAIGFLEGGIIIGVVLVLLTKHPLFGIDKAIMGSNFAPFFLHFVQLLWKLVPPEFLQAVKELLGKFASVVPMKPSP